MVIYLLLENSKGSGTVETIYKEHKIGGGSVMPLCGIMLPPSKNQRESANMMLFADTTAARTRITPLVLSCLPFTILVLNNNEIKINPSMNKLLSRLAYLLLKYHDYLNHIYHIMIGYQPPVTHTFTLAHFVPSSTQSVE